jgi:hypothetical protein
MIFAIVAPMTSRPQSPAGHGKLAFGEKLLIVDGVLVKRGELHETGMHGPGHGVGLRIVLAGAFAESGGCRRKLVPESVEIDALSTGHESLHVRPTEAKVRQQRVLEDFLSRPDAG